MNVVFISPQFPPHFFHFVAALRERGVNVLGLGDTPYDALRQELRDSLSEYFFTPNLHDVDALARAVGYFTWRHGRIHRIDSLNETWLEVESHLREAFHVPGLQPSDIARLRSKFGMHEVFKQAGLPHPDAILVRDARTMVALVKDERIQLTPVEPGLNDGQSVQLRTPLDEGALVALDLPIELGDGSHIQPLRRQRPPGSQQARGGQGEQQGQGGSGEAGQSAAPDRQLGRQQAQRAEQDAAEGPGDKAQDGKAQDGKGQEKPQAK